VIPCAIAHRQHLKAARPVHYTLCNAALRPLFLCEQTACACARMVECPGTIVALNVPRSFCAHAVLCDHLPSAACSSSCGGGAALDPPGCLRSTGSLPRVLCFHRRSVVWPDVLFGPDRPAGGQQGGFWRWALGWLLLGPGPAHAGWSWHAVHRNVQCDLFASPGLYDGVVVMSLCSSAPSSRVSGAPSGAALHAQLSGRCRLSFCI
jgi:hypothetical protein